MTSNISLILCVTYFVISTTTCDAAKILAVFPVPSISHQVVFRPLTQELARRGHDVTVITPDPVFSKDQSPSNFTEIDLHDISYSAWRRTLKGIASSSSNDIVSQSKLMFDTMAHIFEIQIKSPEVQTLLNQSKKFDLLLLEACTRPTLGLSHLYKVPVIAISSFGNMIYNKGAVGIPQHPLLYPVWTHKRVHNLTTWEKVTEIVNHFRSDRYFDGSLLKIENEMLKRVFDPNVRSTQDLTNNINMLLLNMDPMWMSNVPVPPNVINIWGIHERAEEELPEDLTSYLDSSKHGVIYMSFGTNIVPSALPEEKIQAFVKVFSQLPYDVLWKWDKDEIPGKSANIRIGKWFPQSSLLRHPNVKLFITQGGLQSTEEAIMAGVPLVGVPLLGDQWYNVEQYEHFNIGKRLDFETLTENDVRLAIDKVLSDDSYRQNIVRLNSLMSDQPQSALERAVWWTEHVLRHKGGRHLRSPAANISWTQYYELEMVFSVVFVLPLVFIFICFTLRVSCQYILKFWGTESGPKFNSRLLHKGGK